MNTLNKTIIMLATCCNAIWGFSYSASAQNPIDIPYAEDYQMVTHDGARG